MKEVVVCRYGTCHRHLHLHRYWVRDGKPKDLEDPRAGKQPYNEKARLAEADLRASWREYRAKMELKGA